MLERRRIVLIYPPFPKIRIKRIIRNLNANKHGPTSQEGCGPLIWL